MGGGGGEGSGGGVGLCEERFASDVELVCHIPHRIAAMNPRSERRVNHVFTGSVGGGEGW